MPRVRVDAIDLYVEERGAGFPILGIHGTPSSAVMWESAAAMLAQHGRAITYDRRGFLRSGLPAASRSVDLGDHVDDAHALLALLGATPAIVIGRSTGGLVALEFARAHPSAVRALVLLEPAVFTIDPEVEAWAGGLRRRTADAAAEDPDGAAEAVLRLWLGDAMWESLPGELQAMFARTSPGVRAELDGDGLDLSARPRRYTDDEYAAVTMPALIVAADESPEPLRRVAERLAERLPGARLARVGGGHLIDPAGPEVLRFVDEHLVGRPVTR
ncbi:alpha/beta hydrolase [Agromyces sp. SYSU K20354]|uniref:alpha/beta fold hydrolase n=1 Tax=Agromyces cavernae TaxID=2898659 RepID=UPI001E602CE3|nr:alpha/beta fold hydrolase [Agromyces cavernae]MCD2442839.1 alpha/beta hydrolase [Agromyces cavernae]